MLPRRNFIEGLSIANGTDKRFSIHNPTSLYHHLISKSVSLVFSPLKKTNWVFDSKR